MNLRLYFAGLGLTIIAAASNAQADHRLVELPRDPPVEMFRAQVQGFKTPSDMLRLSISMPYGDPDGIQRFADAVSDPANPLYRHFISPAEVGVRFGLPISRVQKVVEYLTSQGMRIRMVSKNHLSILADATVAQAEAAFHTTIETFAAVDGSPEQPDVRFSFTTPPAVPVEIAPFVQDIGGMENFTRPRQNADLTAPQLRSLYSAAGLYSAGGKEGAGRTIAISNFDGYRLSNVPLEITLQGLPTPAAGAGKNITIEPIAGGTGSTGTTSGEGDLDIQAVLSMAPLSSVVVYDDYQPSGSSTSENPITVLTQEVDDNTADIITESYGWSMSTATNLAAHNLHLSMTSQGITYCAAAGDHGTTWVVSGVNFDYPAIEPEVMLVGGTSATVTSAGVRSTEVGWNSGGDFGGGGWNVTVDTFNTRPAYQSTTTFLAGANVPSLAGVPYRLVPDVAFDADPNTGYLIYYGGVESSIGGTSGASPTCAGMIAELEEQLITDGALKANSSGKYRMGRMQDMLYTYGGNASVFFDIVSGTNGTLPNGVSSMAGVGWDTDSGWGPIIYTGLLAAIEKGISTVSLSASSVTGGLAVTGTVTLDLAAPTGGAVVALASSLTAAATVPASVTVAAGATTGTFTVTSLAVASTQAVTITATYNSIARTAALTVNAPAISSVGLSPTSVIGAVSSTGTVTISGPAPTGGTVVSLKSSSTSATVPVSVTVAAAAKTATFTVTTVAVTANATATITATLGTGTATAGLAVAAPSASALALSASSVVGGSNVTIIGTVTITGAAPSGGSAVILASSATTAATVPASLTVAAGAKTATFTATDLVVTSSTSTTIKATLNGVSASATLAVTPYLVSSLALSPASLVGGNSSTGTVTLSATTKSAAITVKLASSSKSATVPASVSVAIGSATATFTVKTAAVTTSTSSTITATYGSGSKTATLTIQS